MALNKFTIETTVKITPANQAKTIIETIAAAYGDRGPEEDGNEYLARKAEEFLLNVFKSRYAEEQAHALRTELHSSIDQAATIRTRPDAEPPVTDIEGGLAGKRRKK